MGQWALQRKHYHILGLLLGIILIIMGFTAESAHRSHERFSQHHSTPQIAFYPVTLSDNAKLNNTIHSKIIMHASGMLNFSEIHVGSAGRCSDQFALINHAAMGLPESVLKVAMRAYLHARGLGLDARRLLTVVDFQKPSDEKRLFVFDLKSNKLLFDTFVSHGARTGKLYAKYFSNRVNSLESSLGVILTGKGYPGIMGYSMRLHGLEQRFNSNVFQREVVMHPAPYTTRSFIRDHHEAGKSFGCLAISTKVAKRLINTIKGGTIIVDYFPSSRWLYHSRFLR